MNPPPAILSEPPSDVTFLLSSAGGLLFLGFALGKIWWYNRGEDKQNQARMRRIIESNYEWELFELANQK